MTQSNEQKLMKLAYDFYSPLFAGYDKPHEATNVWLKHLGDLYNGGLVKTGKEVAAEVTNAKELEIGLELLIAEGSSKLVAASIRKNEIDDSL